MPFKIIRNDITKVKADVIVNTANPKPIFASGTDKAIYQAAGADEVLAERIRIGDIKRGDVAVTNAYRLDAKYIIHTVGPAWIDGEHHEFDILESCYRKSLDKDIRLKPATVIREDLDEPEESFCMFTDFENQRLKPSGDIILDMSIVDVMRFALEDKKVAGLVINPFGQFFRMDKEMLAFVLDEYERAWIPS